MSHNKEYNRELIEEIKTHLKEFLIMHNVKFNGKYFHCFNPYHDDKHESAMIMEDGKRFKCFRCSFFGDIFDAYEVFYGKAHFKEKIEHITNILSINRGIYNQTIERNNPTDKTRAILEAEYIYFNDKGNEVYKICRYTRIDGDGKFVINKKGKKDKFFIAYRKEGNCWVKGMSDAKRYLYNLPKVQEAIKNDEIIIFVEGEKCCDILNKMGFCATTIPFGANSVTTKYMENYKMQLKDAKIVFISDNDNNGFQFISKFKNELKDIASIKEIVLKDVIDKFPEAGDIEEYFALGGTKEKLIELIDNAPNIY